MAKHWVLVHLPTGKVCDTVGGKFDFTFKSEGQAIAWNNAGGRNKFARNYVAELREGELSATHSVCSFEQ